MTRARPTSPAAPTMATFIAGSMGGDVRILKWEFYTPRSGFFDTSAQRTRARSAAAVARVQRVHRKRPGSLHCEEMFPGSLVASLQGFLVERASSVRIRSHANHSPAPEHHGVIG